MIDGAQITLGAKRIIEVHTREQEAIKRQFRLLLQKCYTSPEYHLKQLLTIFEDTNLKNKFKSLVSSHHAGSFAAHWDGARTLINTVEQKNDPKAKQADLSLLKEDLNKLANFI